jgi:hypothetical protein
VFEPIVSKIKNAIESSKSKDASKKWVLRLKRINELEKQYKDGVPEDKMGDVATASGYKIMIKDILGNDINVYNDKSKKGQIIFTNTRANHIDTGFVSLDEKGVELVINILKERVEKYKECAMVISHRKESIKAATGEIIFLEKNNGITRKVDYVEYHRE